MTIDKVYEAMGADFEEVIGRLLRESIVEKFAKKFLEDSSYAELETALEKGDAEEAFRAVHTLKGICINLEYTKLAKACDALTEELRALVINDNVIALMDDVRKEYIIAIEAINSLD